MRKLLSSVCLVLVLLFTVSSFVLPAWGDIPTVGINNGGCTYYTIQNAVDAATSGNSIQVTAGPYNENVDIDTKNLTIDGGYDATCTSKSGGPTTVDGGSIDSVFDIQNSTVTLLNLNITGGNSFAGGGVAIYSGNSQVTLNNSDVFGNQASYGGGIYVDVGSILTTTNNSEIRNNTATVAGGGVRIWGTFIANDNYSDIYENSAPDGGGISVPGGTAELNTADVYKNEATAVDGKGGGIYVNNGGTITLSNGAYIYYDNKAYDGAGIYADNATVTMQGNTTTLRDNIASNHGGAVYLMNNSTLTSDGGRIGQEGTIGIANEALRGAGIYAIDSTVNFSGNIVNNIAVKDGGGIYADNSIVNLSSNTTVYDNTAHTGGAFNLNDSTLEAINTIFRDNQATGDGGAIAAYGSTLTFDADFALCDPLSTQCMSFYNNEADTDGINADYGGAIYLENGNLSMDHTYLHHNSAYRGGAIYQVGWGTPVGRIRNSLFYNNTVRSDTGSAIQVATGNFFLTHVTLADNIGAPSVSSASGVGNIEVFNTIAWGNPSGGFQGLITDSGCNIDQSGNAGIVSDPLFASPGPGEDYHLQKNSPAINACSSGLPKDLDNRQRRLYDMGAFEYPSTSAFPWPLFIPSLIGNSSP